MNDERQRKPHAVLDLSSHHKKAEKIERLLGLEHGHKNLRLLEIGTGSGGIAHYFAHHPSRCFQVVAVDVVDQRRVHDGYIFQRVSGTDLPYPDSSFDIVLSNHVIEHVGDTSAQLAHLQEMHRVMKPTGVGYLATPNRWMMIEPHYRLAFLSWLPKRLRSPYLRLWQRGDNYDCEPLSVSALENLLRQAQFTWEHLEVPALRALATLEQPSPILRFLSRLPDWLLCWLQPLSPTLICRLAKPQKGIGMMEVFP
ncbi:class I SAM-dependent methyltransferase [Desulfosoma caldarium]|uniref:Methyltransferase family protein n=1 Tax=Desulfosoma caldarium TaxID=610254 RepID=A0A3N1UPV1_9BACT|nr:class I SAM-dependent methyltransferase [Desulfosoma caldarium]ROQ90780.1 methyltransferase family protein [Desulfosoma caldarium]